MSTPRPGAKHPFPRGTARRLLALATSAGLLLAVALAAPADAGRSPDPSPAAARALATARGLFSDRTLHDARLEGPAGVQTDPTLALRDLALALPGLHGADREEARGILARPTSGGVPPDGSQDPTYRGPQTLLCDARFCVHYVTAANDVNASTAAQAHLVLSTLDHVYETETGMGYRSPLADTPTTATPSNPDGRFDVFLAQLGSYGYYGYTATDGSSTAPQQPAYLVLDNDFSRAEFGEAPTSSLEVTIAHEFFHAIQFAYDLTEDSWLVEGTAVWMEDQVYGDVNDYRQYLVASGLREPRVPTDAGGPDERYGAVLFWKFLSERLHDPGVIRQVWEAAEGPTYSLAAVVQVLGDRGIPFASLYPLFGVWNTLPTGTYAERTDYLARYPPRFLHDQLLGRRSGPRDTRRDTGWRAEDLPHLSSWSERLRPAAGLRRRSRLRVRVDLPPSANGSAATVQVRLRSGPTRVLPLRLSPRGDASVVVGFAPRTVASVVVVVTSASPEMTACGSGTGYSCHGRGRYDYGQLYRVRAQVR